MFQIKKGARLQGSLFLLITLSVFCVFYFSFKELFLEKEVVFELAQKADFSKEYKKAERYYLLATKAENKNLKRLSCYYLGLLYKKTNKDTGVKNFKKAENYLKEAAILGLKEAQYELALLYDTGDKVQEDRAAALYWMEQSAAQDFAEAQYALAVWQERGYYGKVDMQKALSLYEKAANKDYEPAVKGLALIYKLGAEGISPDEKKASFWMKKVLKNKKERNM